MGGRCRGWVVWVGGLISLGPWKRSGKPERSLCEFLLGFGLERRWGGRCRGWVVWVGGLISSGPGNALENPNGLFANFCEFLGLERRWGGDVGGGWCG